MPKLVLLIIFIGCALSVSIDESCKDVLNTIIKRQMGALKSCMEEMKLKNGREKASRMMCLMKCSLMREGFLDKDGNVDLVGSVQFMDNLPGTMKDKALELFMGCHEHVGKIDPQEETCRSYEPMLKCCQRVINKLCLADEEVASEITLEITPAPA